MVVVAVWVLPRRRRKSIRAKRTTFWWQKILMAGKKILRSFIWRPWVPVWSLLGNGLAASFCFHWILPPSCKSFPHLSHIPEKVTNFKRPSTSHHYWKSRHYPTKILMDFASNAQSRRFVWALELLHSKNCVSCSQFCSPHPQVPLTHRSLPRWLCHLRSQPRCRHLNHWSKLLFSKSYTLLAIQIDHTSPQFIVLNFKKSWTIQCNLAQGQNFFSSCGVHTRESKRAAN